MMKEFLEKQSFHGGANIVAGQFEDDEEDLDSQRSQKFKDFLAQRSKSNLSGIPPGDKSLSAIGGVSGVRMAGKGSGSIGNYGR